MYRVIIVDDHEIFRNGLKLFLNMIDGVNVIGEASNGKEFLDLLKKKSCDLVFMDINMPVLNGINATEEALKKYPDLKIVALTTFGNSDYFNKMVYAGVEGFMLKNSSFNDFKKAIEKVVNGGNYFSDELLSNFTKNVIIKQSKKESLTELSKREKEVLELICKGYSNHKIGEELFISARTVERHKTNILLKTDTLNTVNLVIFAFKNKLVDFSENS